MSYSLIFKTITDEATGATNSIGLFGTSFQNLKKQISENGIKSGIKSIFSAGDVDVDYIKKYNQSIASAINPQKAMTEAISGTNKATGDLIKQADGAAVSQATLTAATKTSTLATKAQALAFKALSVAGNLAVMFLASKAIEVAYKAWDNYAHRVENAKKALEESKSVYDTTIQKIADLETQLEDVNKQMRELESSKGIENLVHDDAYNKLKDTAIELENVILLQHEQQRLEALTLTKDARKSYTTTVDSQYKEAPVQSRKDGYDDSFSDKVLPVDELKLALNEYQAIAKQKEEVDAEIIAKTKEQSQIADITSKDYKNLQKDINKLTKESDGYATSMNDASQRAYDMHEITGNLSSTFEQLIQNGGTLNATDQAMYDTTQAANGEYLDFVDTLNQASEATKEEADAQSELAASNAKTVDDIAALKSEVESVTASYTALNAAIADQETGKSVEMTEELEEYRSCLEYTNGTIQINAEKARELARAKAEEKLTTLEATDAQEKAQYLENAKNIETYTKALGDNSSVVIDGVTVTEEYIQSLRDSNSQIVQNCDQYSLFAAQIRESTGAYQEWLASQNASESGTMFTDAGNAVKAIQEGLANGKTGTIKYNAAIKFLMPDTVDTEDQAAVKEYLSKLERYLADNGSGMNNFIADAMSEGLIVGTEDGMSKIADGKTVQDFVDTLKITPEMAQAIFGELEEYGWEFDWDTESIGSLEEALFDAKTTVSDLQAELYKEKTLNVDTTETQAALDEATKTYDGLVEKLREQIDANINTEEFESKLEKVKALEEYIQKNKELVLVDEKGGDTSKLENDIAALNEKLTLKYHVDLTDADTSLATLKEELFSLTGLNEITIEAYTADAEKKLNELSEKIKNLPNGSAQQREAQAEYDELSKSLDIVKEFKIEKDQSVDDSQSTLTDIQEFTIDDKTFKVLASTDNAMTKLRAVKNYLDNLNDTTVKPGDPMPVKSKNGGAGANGTAHATGDWGTAKAETALIGELGREIVVNPTTGKWQTYGDNGAEFAKIPKGAIIFNHLQTEELLERGFVNGRGSAYVNGTAYPGGILNGSGPSIQPVTGTDSVSDNANKLKESAASSEKIAKSSKETTKEAEKQSKEFDWIKTALDYISREREKVADVVESENVSYETQLSTVQQLIDLDNQMIATNTAALDNYKNQWEEVKEKIIEAFGAEEGNSLISKIMQGDVSLDGWMDSIDQNTKTGEKQAELVENGKSVFSAYKEQEKELGKVIKQGTEDQQKQFEIRINMIKSYLDEVSADMDNAESSLSIKETTGKIVTEADYKNLISLSEDQIDLYYDQIDALDEQLDELDEGSAEWYNVKSQIASCNSSINQCEQSQAEWNEEILNLPIKRVERYLELLENIKTDLNNYISEQDALGIGATKDQLQSLIDISTQQITKLQEQHKLLTDKLGNYEYGSDKFNETQNEIQSVEDEVSDLIQSQREWNNQILQIPIDKISDLTDRLSSIKDALTAVTDEYDTAISAVTQTIDRQIDSINDLKDATTEAYDEKIDPLQEQLDLLNKQNEARQIQLNLEQTEYDWQRAHNQKINQVVRNGKVVYESDKDAERDASSSYQDALMDKTKYDIQTQIDSLTEERDAILEGYDKQIDKLDEIKEKWSEITENIQYAKDVATADQTFGDSWVNKVLTGEDNDIYEMLKNNYENVESQKEIYDKQIDANEKMTTLMQQYIEAYQNGTMTYEQILTKFDSLIAAAENGFTAEENLKALMELVGDKDVDTALNNVKGEISASYDNFKQYFESVNTNTDTIAKYTDTWETIRQTLVEQLALLKKQAEDEAKRVATQKKKSSHKSSGGSSSKGPNWNTPDNVATGPGKAYKNGIENGPVKSNPTDTVSSFQSLALKELDPDEVAATLHVGEIVLNPEQMYQTLDNLRGAMGTQIVRLPVQPQGMLGANVEISFGDLTLPNVTNGEEFAESLTRNFEPLMTQYFSKKF